MTLTTLLKGHLNLIRIARAILVRFGGHLSDLFLEILLRLALRRGLSSLLSSPLSILESVLLTDHLVVSVAHIAILLMAGEAASVPRPLLVTAVAKPQPLLGHLELFLLCQFGSRLRIDLFKILFELRLLSL